MPLSKLSRRMLWPGAPSAVAAVPDARKGEKLVLITQRPGAKRADFQAFAKSRGAAELMIPAEIHAVEKVPLLGSGKFDYVGVTILVRDALAQNLAEPARIVQR